MGGALVALALGFVFSIGWLVYHGIELRKAFARVHPSERRSLKSYPGHAERWQKFMRGEDDEMVPGLGKNRRRYHSFTEHDDGTLHFHPHLRDARPRADPLANGPLRDM